ncbi:MAG: hypothetical protein OXB93_06055 [Cytophagales bacterium]|nr:hypothetical protein [Cytophagales bacterium]
MVRVQSRIARVLLSVWVLYENMGVRLDGFSNPIRRITGSFYF